MRHYLVDNSGLPQDTAVASATKEATRDGAPPIDLVDGDELARKLKELGLGVKTELIEQVSVDPAWFQGL